MSEIGCPLLKKKIITPHQPYVMVLAPGLLKIITMHWPQKTDSCKQYEFVGTKGTKSNTKTLTHITTTKDLKNTLRDGFFMNLTLIYYNLPFLPVVFSFFPAYDLYLIFAVSSSYNIIYLVLLFTIRFFFILRS